ISASLNGVTGSTGLTVATAPPNSSLASYSSHNLVSDGAVPAVNTDKNLVNPWGIVASPTSPFWVSDNGTGLSTLYDGFGNVQTGVFTVPPPTGQTGASTPTGIVNN